MITKKELLRGNDVSYSDEYTAEISQNLDNLLIKLNKFRAAYAKPMICTSGWRPRSVNNLAGGSVKSNHLTGHAADFSDPHKKLANFCLQNEELLTEIGLWLEHPSWTKNWIHFQDLPPKSGKRYYIP